MIRASLPVKEAKPLIKIPKFIPQAGFLGGEKGKEINEEIRKKYKGFPELQESFYDDGIIKGSTPFYVVAVNEIIKPQGLRTATPADLGRILKINALNLKGYYEDAALVLINDEGSNVYLAKDLMNQIKKRTGKDSKTPIMIPLSGLELRTDQSSPYNLAFNLTENTEIICAPQLVNENEDRKFNETNDKGLPIFNKNGSRSLYTGDSGLSRLLLYDDLSLNFYDEYLDDSDDDGRVVIVSGEVDSSQDSEKFLRKGKF